MGSMDNLFKDIKLNQYEEKELDIRLSAFEVFKRLYPYCKNIFLLESLGEEGKFNRYSYIGFNPLLMISAKNRSILINDKHYEVNNPYKMLSQMPQVKLSQEGYCGGLVGYITYEATKYFEPAFVGFESREFPDFEFGFFPDGLKFDKKTHKCVYFYSGKSRLLTFQKFLNFSGKLHTFKYERLDASKSQEQYQSMVFEALQEIKKGNIFQVVLSLKNHFHITGDTRRIYASLRQINPSPYMIYFKFGEREMISASPELLIRVKGKEIEHFGTLAGTIRRGSNIKEDKLLAMKLQNDEKEKAEHMMLVDLARNDMGRICEFGSIKVTNLAKVKGFSHVQHLSTEIRGKLHNREDYFSALSSCFPAGTLTGAPKVEAMKIIKNLEGESRGPYAGVGGYFSLNGDVMLAILIRSIFIANGNAYTQTGSGIVLDSLPDREFQEIKIKQKAIEEALRQASL